MKILHVIGSLSPDLGGPPEGLRQLVQAYPHAGVEVEVVCQDAPGSTFLSTVACPVHALGRRRGTFGFSPRLWQWLHRHAAEYDGLVMDGLWIFPDLAVHSAARRAQVPYAVFTHGALNPWFQKNYPLKHVKKLAFWRLQYPVLRDAYAVLFTSPMERDLATRSFRPNHWNSVLVPFGMNDPVGEPAAQINAFYRQLPAIRDKRFLLFMGRLHASKGCDLLVRAFASLADRYPDVDLVMAGPDQVGWKPELEQIAAAQGAAHRVHWPGMITGDAKWGALRASEGLVVPSHLESFGMSIVEALAVGRPVLITNKVNIFPDIEADQVGLVDDDTLEGIDRLLRRWLDLPLPAREAIAARTYPSFTARYSMKNAAIRIRELFEDAAGSGLPAPSSQLPTAAAAPEAVRTPPAPRTR